ncbi:MAG TPA: peptidylprolyl isomerase [Giesbergeria sp.]|nr:peptidylprolyl isomerase [Giesbergeria sp.]HRA14399.1 peptidylprolyl isomerase [Giesbergeria sp.]
MISRRNSTLALAGIALSAIISVAPAHAEDAPKVKLATSMGDIVVQLDPAKAPKTVENFLTYVKDKHYDGTIFHRVIDGFMIQGGGFTADMVQKPMRAPIPLEAANGLKNDQYTIAMARTNVPDSATAQFFINVKNNAMLNAPQPDGHGYAVFGKVIQGTEVVDKIKAAATSNKGPHQNVPSTPITITSATLVK